MTLNLGDVSMPSEVLASPSMSPATWPSLRTPRRQSFHGSGPDRLSPHRRPGMTSTR